MVNFLWNSRTGDDSDFDRLPGAERTQRPFRIRFQFERRAVLVRRSAVPGPIEQDGPLLPVHRSELFFLAGSVKRLGGSDLFG
jgi:hypothetical protein